VNDVMQVMRPDGNLPIRRWLPTTGSGSGVLVLHEIFGVSPYVEARCADLADAGYVVYAPELYFRLGRMTFLEDSPSYVQEGVGASQRLDWEQTSADASAALGALRAEVEGRVGIVGFCFGGGLGFQVAARDIPDALVSYYGSAIPGLLALAPRVTCPSLHHWGLADSFFPPTVVEEVERAVTSTEPPAQFHTYPGAEHAFDNPHPLFFNASASQLAWQRTLEFLDLHLGGRQPA